MFAKDEPLELLGADERARQGGGHAELDEEIDENEAWFQH